MDDMIKKETRPEKPYARDISKYIRMLYLHRRRFVNAHINHKKLHGSMYSMITYLGHNPGANQDMLCRELRIDKSNITRLCHQLENMGYITRVHSTEDKRRNMLYLTEKGQEVIPVYRELLSIWHDSVTEGMSDDERETLFKLLERMMKNTENFE